MIIYSKVDWSHPGIKQDRVEKGIEGMPVAYVIDSEVVLTSPVDKTFAELLSSATNFVESKEQPTDGSFSVDIYKNDIFIDTLICGEMVYAILLSDPTIVMYNQDTHQYGEYVMEGWTYSDGKFTLKGEFE